ncbi:MAG: ImmA/IrrE family metallo-endopeptidase [Chloroflexi bacterium]|nr:MAG: ImmA/IrrE family metallo-endopeptidase [Chloroflexota bacterium]
MIPVSTPGKREQNASICDHMTLLCSESQDTIIANRSCTKNAPHNCDRLVREYRKEHEEQAAYMGGCLQIPGKALQWAYQLQMTRKQVADRFGASLEMVRWRCNDTGFAEKIL